MIINSHLHINPSCSNCFFYNDYTLKRLLHEMDSNNVDIAFPSLNPKLNIFRCVNDCSYNCPFSNGINNNMENCINCTNSKKHRTQIVDNGTNLSVYCKTCKKVLYSGYDPVRIYNIDVIEKTRPLRNRIKPFVFLTISNSCIQREIDFFETNYSGEFVGYKLHPWTNQVSVRDLHLKTSLPILIHTGIREIESTSNAIIFAKNHPANNIVLAHAAQLDESYLKQIASLDNVYIDCCPSTFMFKEQQSSFTNSSLLLHSPEDIYKIALSYLSSKKILFGSDSPWGNMFDELQTIYSLNITQQEKDDILFKNATAIYSV